MSADRSNCVKKTLIFRRKTASVVFRSGGWIPGPRTRPPPRKQGRRGIGGIVGPASASVLGVTPQGESTPAADDDRRRSRAGPLPCSAGATHPQVAPADSPRRVARAMSRTKIISLVAASERVRPHVVGSVRTWLAADPAHVRQREHSLPVATVTTRTRARHRHHQLPQTRTRSTTHGRLPEGGHTCTVGSHLAIASNDCPVGE